MNCCHPDGSIQTKNICSCESSLQGESTSCIEEKRSFLSQKLTNWSSESSSESDGDTDSDDSKCEDNVWKSLK